MRIRTTSCLMAGVNEATFGTDTPEQIAAQVADGVNQSGGLDLLRRRAARFQPHRRLRT